MGMESIIFPYNYQTILLVEILNKEQHQLEIYICQTCGNVLRSEDVSCSNCRTPFSRHSATAMPVLANAKPAKSSRLQPATDQKSLQTTNTGQAPKKTRATVPTSTSMDSKPSTDPVHDFFETPRHQELPLKNGVDEASLLSNLLNERSNNKTAKSKKENEKPCPTPFLPAGRNGVIAIAAVAASSMLIALGFFFGSTVSRPSATSQSPSEALLCRTSPNLVGCTESDVLGPR